MRSLLYIAGFALILIAVAALLATAGRPTLATAPATAAALTIVFIITKVHETVVLCRGLAADFRFLAEAVSGQLADAYEKVAGTKDLSPGPEYLDNSKAVEVLKVLHINALNLPFYDKNLDKLALIPTFLLDNVMRVRHQLIEVQVKAEYVLERSQVDLLPVFSEGERPTDILRWIQNLSENAKNVANDLERVSTGRGLRHLLR